MDPALTWRNRTKNFQIQTTQVKTTKTGTSAPVVRSNVSGVSGTYNLMSDNNHPNFLFRTLAGEIIMGDCVLQRNVRNYNSGSLTWSAGTTTCTITGDFASQVIGILPIPVVWTSANLSSLMDATLISAFAKITQDSVMSSETLIGLAQTVNMLRSPLSKSRDHLGRMFKSASASYGKTAESVTRANADAWLEYRYGMLPLYLDVNQVIKIFSKKYTELERRRAVVRSGQEVQDNRTIAMSSRALPVLTNIGYQFYAAGSVDVQRTLRISSGVMYEVSPRTLAQELAVQFSLGSTAMPSSLWEQIPFSFVGDWFFNVGDWLAANNLPPDVTVKGNWTTALQNHEDTYTSSELYMMMNGTKRYGSWGSGSKTSVIYDRRTNRPLATLPVMVQKYATVTHALDAVALLLNPVKDLIVKLR